MATLSRDPRRLSKLVRNEFIQLREIVAKAAVLSSWIVGLTQQMKMKQHVPQNHQAHFFNLALLTYFNLRELENYSKNVFSQMKHPIHKNALITCVKLLKIRVCLAHGKHKLSGELHYCLQKQHFQLTNINLQSLLL